jgi:hypothetical protein
MVHLGGLFLTISVEVYSLTSRLRSTPMPDVSISRSSPGFMLSEHHPMMIPFEAHEDHAAGDHLLPCYVPACVRRARKRRLSLQEPQSIMIFSPGRQSAGQAQAAPAITQRQFCTICPASISISVGSVCAHAGVAVGQRVWKRQPEGGAMGEGNSPWITLAKADPRAWVDRAAA